MKYTRQAQYRRSETWQIIYMDLMTIVMVFFVILWSLNQGKDAGISETVGDQTVRMVTLPGDVLFDSGQSVLSGSGQEIFRKLFAEDADVVLNFETGGLVKRVLVIHGHTDTVGEKDENFALGYRRAFAVYKQIQQYGEQVPNHVVLCSHADNTPEQAVPVFQGAVTPAQRSAVREANAKNRRITIEDSLVNIKEEDE
jgi:outer membrane protein OmpA-like peptidoglycan-associated protein